MRWPAGVRALRRTRPGARREHPRPTGHVRTTGPVAPPRSAPYGERGFGTAITALVVSMTVSLSFLIWLWAETARRPEPAPAHTPLAQELSTSDGRVVDATTGEPLRRGQVTLVSGTQQSATVSQDGGFQLELSAPALLRVTARGYASRVLAVAPGQDPTIGLMPRGAGSLTLRFGGDAMLGRRFYEASDSAPAWLTPGSDVRDHEAPLRQIAPLLGDADLTVVNLETSLVDRPYFADSRPHTFNQEKDLVFASGPETAVALKESGVDVVDLGNNHVYDALASGLASTIDSVDAAGLAHFGAGMTLEEAWRPAYVEAHGQRVAFIGCTTITGEQYQDAYVVRPGQGGAASCEPGLLATAVSRARADADVVVVMMHGGVEYQNTQDDTIRSLSKVAADAGATVVVNGHPHVIGGITETDGVPVAETMGNLMFDQNLWSTLRSYLLRVDLQDGRPVRTSVDPFAISDYSPVPTTGLLADSSARVASGLLFGPMLLDVGGASTVISPQTPAKALAGPVGSIATIPSGLWLTPGQRQLSPGQDLLYGTGSFEKMDTSPDTDPPVPALWGIGKYTRLTNAAACTGSRGLQLVRNGGSDFDVIATPLHRVPVTPGDHLSVTVDVRRATESAQLEMRWYDDLLGASAAVESVPLGPYDGARCRQVTLDLTVPPGMVAGQPYLRIAQPADSDKAGELMADNVRMVRWSAPGSGGRIYDTVRFDAATRAHLVSD